MATKTTDSHSGVETRVHKEMVMFVMKFLLRLWAIRVEVELRRRIHQLEQSVLLVERKLRRGGWSL